jgi:hypothetical protein
MNTCKLFWSWLMCCAAPLYIGGDSGGNESKTDNSNTNIDKRLVTDADSVGVSADHSTVSLNLQKTDLGAITKAFDFATNARKGISDDFGKVTDLAGDSLSFAKETSKLTNDAYKVMQDTVSGNRTVALTGLLIAGVVAAIAFGRKIKL